MPKHIVVLFMLWSTLACDRQDEAARLAAVRPGTLELSVLNYNVQSRPVLDRRRAGSALPQIGAKIAAFDFASVQECFVRCELLLDAAPVAEKTWFKNKKRWWHWANSGLATLARWPKLKTKTWYFSRRAEFADRLASKGVLLTSYYVHGLIVDVYNTHMQAGHSQAAQRARQAQADELADIIAAASKPEHLVILHGDFNMGPERAGRAWADFSPNHYASPADMQARTATFATLMARLALVDVADTVHGPRYDHIERVLYRRPVGIEVAALEFSDLGANFVDAKTGRPLSDSAAILARLSIKLPAAASSF